MIYNNNKEILGIYIDNKIIKAVYSGTKLVWQLAQDIKSCFGSGVWINNLPWLNTDSWKNY